MQIDLLNHIFTGGDAAGDTLISIQNVTGSANADTLKGDGAANELLGMDGRDLLMGRGGADILDGGNGIDTVDFTELTAITGGVTVSLNAGDGTAVHNGVTDTLRSIENVNGSFASDSITGNNAANYIWGNAGVDTMTGGGGADRFIYKFFSEFDLNINDTFDETITDFSHAQGDKIDLRGLGFQFVAGNSFSAQLQNQVLFDNGVLWLENSGDAIADYKIVLQGVTSFDETDLILT